ncbi:hypothetical protein ACHAPO_000856 [Fusarium lateritium]
MKRNAPSGGFGGGSARKKGKKNFYAVKVGRAPGIYHTWDECSEQVNRFPGAVFQGFVTAEEAREYMGGSRVPSASVPTARTPAARTPSASVTNASGSKNYYAVAVGIQPGIYNTWEEASPRIQGVGGAKHKKFNTLGEAEDYIRQFGAPETCQSLGIAPGPGQQARESRQEPRQTPAEQTWEPRSTAYEPQKKQYQSAAEARPAARQFQQTQYASAAEQVEAERDARRVQHEEKLEKERQAERERQAHAHAGTGSDGDTIRIYTDGSSLGNGQVGSRAGLGVFFGHDDERNHAERLPGLPQTNQRAELLAILRAMEIVPLTQGIEIWTDSQYSINCVQVWSVNWERNNWMTAQKKPVANKDIVRDIRAKMRERQAAGAITKFQWVKGHASDPGNHEADRLANIGSRMPEVA